MSSTIAASVRTALSNAATTAATTTATSASATPTCTTAVPGPRGQVPVAACNSKYVYEPSLAAAICFAVFFGLVTVGQICLAYYYKKKYCWVMIVGCLWECAAFVFRIIGYYNQQQLAYVVVSTVLLLTAPIWINAFVYMTAGRMVYMFVPEKRIWRIQALSMTKYFVWLDVISFAIQVLSGTLLASQNDDSLVKLGLKIYMTGIGLQEGVIVLFTVLLIAYERRMLGLIRNGEISTSKWWRILTWTLYAVLVMITIRIVFRLVEFSGGFDYDNKLVSEEGYMLGLEATPMLLAGLLLVLVHPGLVLKGPDSEFPTLSRAEKKRLKQENRAEKKAINETKKSEKKMRKGRSGEHELNILERGGQQ